MNQIPLTPADVHGITFDKAPLGKHGYDEDQVDEFLDRIEATLAGSDTLTAEDARMIVFDSAPLIKRGYHEDQVDDFLDRVVAELQRRASNGARELTATAPAVRHASGVFDQTSPMLFSLPPSLSAHRTPRHQPKPDPPAAGPEPTVPVRAGLNAPSELLTFPLPPAPPGTRGYRPADVEKLANLIIRTSVGPDGPTADQIATFRLSRTFSTGHGYHTEVVDELRSAWVAELRYREG